MVNLAKYGAVEVQDDKASDLSKYGAVEVPNGTKTPDQSQMKPPVVGQDPVVEQKQDLSQPGNEIPAFAQGVAGGLGDAGLEMGDLAADILSSFDASKGAGSKLKGATTGALRKNTQSDLELANPISSSVGRGVGYTAGYMIAPSKLVKGAKIAAEALVPGAKLLGSVMPRMLSGALTEATSGGVAGASMQPENRTQGALTGLLLGAPAGALGAATSGTVQRAASEMAPELARMKSLGYATNTPEAIARARQEMASRGTGALKDNIQNRTMDMAAEEVNALKPNSVNIPQKSPARLMTARVNKRFPQVLDEMKQAYAPLDATTNTVVNDLPKLSKTASGYAPTPLGEQAGFKDLQAYRQELDVGIKQAKGKIPLRDLKQLYQQRTQVTAKMEQVASEAGLTDQLKVADDIYKNDYRPFLTFDKTGRLNTPEGVDSTWRKINSLLNATNPNPKELKALVHTLGDEGKDLVGWGSLQNALTKARVGNEISLGKFNSEVNKLHASGLSSIISKPDYQQAVTGINRIISDGKKAANIKTNRVYIPIISPVLEHLMESQSGIKLIIKLGGQDRTSKAYRDAIQQLMTQGPNVLINSISKKQPMNPGVNPPVQQEGL